ncbi:9738_t:CDS:2 [Diversispora eburnea]|uniref:9738_t:CDS:1 n=1 Tax=Diversispora eburnea TaxID=1213867 RepID=A0A9N9ASM4_9GLOM|nr:9738_t:CDS:2 [Diversispora eburnea]
MRMINEEPGLKISYNTNMKEQPMPSGKCPVDFVNNSYNDSEEGYVYQLAFLPKGQIFLGSNDFLWFDILINDEKYNRFDQMTPMTMQAYDSESNGTNVRIFKIIILKWILFVRVNKNTIKKINSTNVFYVVTIETVEYSGSNGYYGRASINLKTPILEVEKEQRARSITEVLANIAALYGLTCGIYVFLFALLPPVEKVTKIKKNFGLIP